VGPEMLGIKHLPDCAGVVEWQTRRTQNPVGVTP
jgi:hypothetical protein